MWVLGLHARPGGWLVHGDAYTTGSGRRGTLVALDRGGELDRGFLAGGVLPLDARPGAVAVDRAGRILTADRTIRGIAVTGGSRAAAPMPAGGPR